MNRALCVASLLLAACVGEPPPAVAPVAPRPYLFEVERQKVWKRPKELPVVDCRELTASDFETFGLARVRFDRLEFLTESESPPSCGGNVLFGATLPCIPNEAFEQSLAKLFPERTLRYVLGIRARRLVLDVQLCHSALPLEPDGPLPLTIVARRPLFRPPEVLEHATLIFPSDQGGELSVDFECEDGSFDRACMSVLPTQ